MSPNDAASLFRVAALPQFAIDPLELRAAMRAVRRDELDLRTRAGKLANGAAVLASVEKAHVEVEQGRSPRHGCGERRDPSVRAARRLRQSALFQIRRTWQTNATTETGRASEFLEYLDYFRQARGSNIRFRPAKTTVCA